MPKKTNHINDVILDRAWEYTWYNVQIHFFLVDQGSNNPSCPFMFMLTKDHLNPMTLQKSIIINLLVCDHIKNQFVRGKDVWK